MPRISIKIISKQLELLELIGIKLKWLFPTQFHSKSIQNHLEFSEFQLNSKKMEL